MRREKSLRIGVHHANGVVWEPVYRTRLKIADALDVQPDLAAGAAAVPFPVRDRRVFRVPPDQPRGGARGGAVGRRRRRSKLRVVPYERTSGWS